MFSCVASFKGVQGQAYAADLHWLSIPSALRGPESVRITELSGSIAGQMTTGLGTASLTNHPCLRTDYIWPREAIRFINPSVPCSTITILFL